MKLATSTPPKNSSWSQKTQGFSLVELLTVIAVIGTLAAIGIPAFLSDLTEAKAATAKRNAQTIATIAQMAHSSGDTTVTQCVTMEAAIGKLIDGVRGQGVLHDSIFTISRLGAEEITAAKPYLQFNDGLLSLR